MKQIIKEVQHYFTQKLLAGEFDVKHLDSFGVEISIDGYEFTFWIGNKKENFKQYNEFNRVNFIQLGLSEDDTLKIWEVLQPKIEAYKNIEWRKRKLKELVTLKRELEL